MGLEKLTCVFGNDVERVIQKEKRESTPRMQQFCFLEGISDIIEYLRRTLVFEAAKSSHKEHAHRAAHHCKVKRSV